MNWFRQIPFLRLLFPLLSGIFTALHLQIYLVYLPLFLILFFFFLCFYLWIFKKTYHKILFLFLSDLFLFVLAWQSVQNQNIKWDKNFYGNGADLKSELKLLVWVSDVPVQKPKTLKLQLDIIELQQNGHSKAVRGKLIAYVKNHKNLYQIKAGQMLYLNTHLLEVPAAANPEEFNYKKYLCNRQIYHFAFVDSLSYKIVLDTFPHLSIQYLALHCKQKIINRLKTAQLSSNAYAICSALITGFDADISQDVRRSFSHSGTLHVLSVSGLHTGLIFAFLSFLFKVFDRRNRFKIFKFSSILLVLWAFAFLTGLEAPVLRSVLMLSLFAVGSVFFKNEQKNQLNLLFVSAFVLLLLNPFFITEIGFQLSFSAMLGLIIFQPLISNLWSVEHPILIWFWKSVAASLSATLTTLPLTLFYFKQFPIWFFVANLVVVPGSFLLLFLAVPAVFHFKFISMLINILTEFLLKFMSLFNSSNAYVDGINFRFEDAFWITAIIAVFTWTLYSRSGKWVLISLFLVLFWQIHTLFRDVHFRVKCPITVYALPKAFAFSVKQRNSFYVSSSDSASFEMYVNPHFLVLGAKDLLRQEFNSIESLEFQVLFLNKQNHYPRSDSLKPTILVLSNSFRLGEKQLTNYSKIKAIVADNSMNRKSSKQAERLSRKFGLLCFNTREQGAFCKEIDEIKNWR